MSSSKIRSTEPKGVPLTPEQRRLGERNLIRLLIFKEKHGLDAAMEEWHRMLAEMRAKAPSSPGTAA